MHPRTSCYFIAFGSLLLACGQTPPAHEPAATPPATEQAPSSVPPVTLNPRKDEAKCLPADTAEGAVAHVELHGREATACYLQADKNPSAGESTSCVVVDLDSRKVTSAKAWSVPNAEEHEAPSAFELSTTKNSVKVCKTGAANDCRTLKVLHKPISAGKGGNQDDNVIAAVSADGSHVFVFAPERLKTNVTVWGDVYAVRTGKRVSHVKLSGLADATSFIDESNDWSARFRGKNLLLGDYVCCGPGGTTQLFDPDKKRAKMLHGYDGEILDLSGRMIAARDEKTLRFFDTEKFQELGTVTATGEGVGSPEQADAMIALDGQTLLLAYTNPPGVVAIDTETKKPEPFVPLGLCP
jgi:hypothetical protein